MSDLKHIDISDAFKNTYNLVPDEFESAISEFKNINGKKLFQLQNRVPEKLIDISEHDERKIYFDLLSEGIWFPPVLLDMIPTLLDDLPRELKNSKFENFIAFATVHKNVERDAKNNYSDIEEIFCLIFHIPTGSIWSYEDEVCLVKICYQLPGESFNDELFYKKSSDFTLKLSSDLANMIEAFIATPNAHEYFYPENEGVFLRYAVDSLIKHNLSYANLLLRYMASIKKAKRTGTNTLLFLAILKTKNLDDKVKLLLIYLTDISKTPVFDTFSELWEEDGYKDIVINNYSCSDLQNIFEEIRELDPSVSFGDIEDLIETLESECTDTDILLEFIEKYQ